MILWNHLTRRVWNFSAESIVCRMFSGWMFHCIELDSKDFKEYVQRAIELDSKDFKEYVQRAIERCVIKRNSLENEKVMASFEWEPVGFVFPAPRNWKTTFLLNELIKLAFNTFVEIIDKVETMPKCGHWVFSSGSHLLPFSFDNENVVNEASRCAMGRQRETRNNKTFLSNFFLVGMLSPSIWCRWVQVNDVRWTSLTTKKGKAAFHCARPFYGTSASIKSVSIDGGRNTAHIGFYVGRTVTWRRTANSRKSHWLDLAPFRRFCGSTVRRVELGPKDFW